MAILLNIDTATTYASVCISENEKQLAFADNATQKDHAAFLHVAIDELLRDLNIPMTGIDAIAVTNGPGSYTGLRVGLSAAKGFCYALEKPLICVNTLKVMAVAAIASESSERPPDKPFFCPMIDARRMEVFTAVYDEHLNTILEPCAMVLDPFEFQEIAADHAIIFTGDGSEKLRTLSNDPSFIFRNVQHSAAHLALLSNTMFLTKSFTGIAYAEPAYYKEFYTMHKV